MTMEIQTVMKKDLFLMMIVSVIFLFLPPDVYGQNPKVGHDTIYSDSIMKILTSVPEDIETFVISYQGLPFPRYDEQIVKDKPEIPKSVSRSIFRYFTARLKNEALRDSIIKEFMRDENVKMISFAGKQCLSTTMVLLDSSEASHYDESKFCCSVIFTQDTKTNFLSRIQPLLREPFEISNHQVYAFRDPNISSPDSAQITETEFYLSFPEPNILFYSNDLNFISESLARMQSSAKKEFFTSGFNEMKYIIPEAKSWGIRRYQHPGHVEKDFTYSHFWDEHSKSLLFWETSKNGCKQLFMLQINAENHPSLIRSFFSTLPIEKMRKYSNSPNYFELHVLDLFGGKITEDKYEIPEEILPSYVTLEILPLLGI